MAPVGRTQRRTILPVLTAGLLSVVVLAACGSSSPSASAPTTGVPTTTAPATTTPTTVQATTTVPTIASTTGTASTGTTSPSSGAGTQVAQNLVVTDALRAQLVQAVEATEGLPAGSYTGLAPGETYYAYDPSTDTYYAGAAVVPSSTSYQAQVSAQDDGGYHLFTRVGATGTWDDQDVGLADSPGATCPLTVPPAVLAVWGWPAGTCAAPGT
jgi:hypothetical protein